MGVKAVARLLRQIAPPALAVLLGACEAAPSASPGPSATASTSPNASQPQATPSAGTSVSVELPPLDEPVPWPHVVALAAGPTGFIALVETPVPTSVDGETQFDVALLLGSPDGADWQRLDVAAMGGQLPQQVTAGGAGWVMSTAAHDADGHATVMLWHSSDARHWTGTPIGRAVTSAQLVAGGPGYVYLDHVPNGDSSQPMAWSSSDGVSWRSNRVEAVSVDGAASSPRCVVAWTGDALLTSTDGQVWSTTERPVNEEAWIGGMFAIDGRMYALAVENAATLQILRSAPIDDASQEPCAFAGEWTEDVELERVFEGHKVVAVSGSGDALTVFGYRSEPFSPTAWTRSGGGWQRHDLPNDAFGGGLSNVFASGPSARVSVGVDVRASGSVSSLWRSTDGLDWEAVETRALARPVEPGSSCPAKPATVAELVDLGEPGYDLDNIDPDFARLTRCFGSDTLRVTGYRVSCECGGVPPMSITPAWRDWLRGGEVLSDKRFEEFGRRLFAFVDPAKVSHKPDLDVLVRVSGHFDDAGSSSCRAHPLFGHFSPLMPAAQAIEICRRQFVVTDFAPVR